MVIKDLKEMFKDEDDHKDVTLFNLVRGETKKRVNFLVTLAEGGMEYVPVRASSMMIRAVEGEENFKPKKRSLIQSLGGGSSSDEEEKEPAKTSLGSPSRSSYSSSSSSSSDELESTPPRQKEQQGDRSSRSNKQASAKLAKGLSEKGKASPSGKKRMKKASSSMSSSAVSPPLSKEMWGHEDHSSFKPSWGNESVSQQMVDDSKRDADEWRTRRGAVQRIAVDKPRMGGESPPRGNRNPDSTLFDEIDDPNRDFKKVRARGYQDHSRSGWEDAMVKEPEASSWNESMSIERQMWGKSKGVDTSDFDEWESWGEENHSCEVWPDCKFLAKEKEGTKRKAKKSQSPKKKKTKKVAVPSKKPRIASPPIAESSVRAQGSPQESSEREESKEKCVCDEERMFLVRIRPGMSQAEILFLNNKMGDGWDGPFDLEVPLKELCEFDLLPLPRHFWTSRQPAMIKELPSEKGKKHRQSQGSTAWTSISPEREESDWLNSWIPGGEEA